MATGGGKSICYQLPGLLTNKLTLVVSPLIALMRDQVSALVKRKIPATYLEQGLSLSTLKKRLDGAAKGRYRLLYVSPERLRSKLFKDYARDMNVGLLSVDEAHCVSIWGHDFRPSYRDIAEIYPLLNRPPVIATTGTATPQVREDIISGLRLRDPVQIVGSFRRPNISFQTTFGQLKSKALRKVLSENKGSGIIYVGSRRQATMWHNWVRREGYTSTPFHAGMTTKARASSFRKWMRQEAQVIVSTNALGMGVDKPGVRFVVHTRIPYSLDAYYQEAGRAGRDNEPALALLLTGWIDRQVQEEVLGRRYPARSEIASVYEAICSSGHVAVGSFPSRPVEVDLASLAETTEIKRVKIERVIKLIADTNQWEVMEGGSGRGMVRMWQGPVQIRRFALGLERSHRREFVMSVLRRVEAKAYREWVDNDLTRICFNLSLTREQFQNEIAFLEARNILSWKVLGGDLQLKFKRARERTPPVDFRAISQNHKRALAHLDAIWGYVDAQGCRSKVLLNHYGEELERKCARCDLCRNLKTRYP